MLYHQNLDWKYVSYVVKSNAQTCHYGHETKEFCTVLAKKIYRSIHHNGKMCFSILRTPIPYEGIISKWMGRWCRDYYDSSLLSKQLRLRKSRVQFNYTSFTIRRNLPSHKNDGHRSLTFNRNGPDRIILKQQNSLKFCTLTWRVVYFAKILFLKSCCQHLQSSYLKSKIHYN